MSDLGRLIAAGVMIGGIALIGVVTATLASWIVERVANRDELEMGATRRDIRALAEEVALLRQSLGERGQPQP